MGVAAMTTSIAMRTGSTRRGVPEIDEVWVIFNNTAKCPMQHGFANVYNHVNKLAF